MSALSETDTRSRFLGVTNRVVGGGAASPCFDPGLTPLA